MGDKNVGISLDETTTPDDISALLGLFEANLPNKDMAESWASDLTRTTSYLEHEVFNSHHSETQLLRYIRKLSDKDIALDRSMIPLGSCTMKLNATSEMIPVGWNGFANVHPHAPRVRMQA